MKTPSPDHRYPDSVFLWLELSSPKRILLFIACAVVAAVTVLIVPESAGLSPAAQRALFILVFAAALWITEAIPAFAVGILVIGLQIALLGEPGGVFAETERDWEEFVAILGHPLIWLFFGGFVLAAGMAETGVDRIIAERVLGRFGNRPATVLLGVMTITFSLSMIMSNTATTAMILALIAPLLASLKSDNRFGAGLVLGVATAANLGGMGSLIGTPPNAIAVGALSDVPDMPDVTFLDWMIIGLPLALTLMLLSWMIIAATYRSDISTLADWRQSPEHAEDGAADHAPRWQRLVVYGTLILTVGLWLTGQWHGLPIAVVSFVPIVCFTVTGITGPRRIRGLQYDVLFLLAGGLALGQVVTDTGLSTWIVELLPIEGLSVTAIALVMAYLTVVLSNFMSNTAAANVLVPIAVGMAAGFEARLAIPIALAASCAMCLPIATPPNAMSYATGRCSVRDFVKMGLLIGLLGPLVAVLWTSVLLPRLF